MPPRAHSPRSVPLRLARAATRAHHPAEVVGVQVGHAVLVALGYNHAVEGRVLALVNANGVFPQPAKVGSGYPVAVLEHARAVGVVTVLLAHGIRQRERHQLG